MASQRRETNTKQLKGYRGQNPLESLWIFPFTINKLSTCIQIDDNHTQFVLNYNLT